MNHNHNVKITTRDRLMMSWEFSMQLVRNYEFYAKEFEDESLRQLFDEFAENEAEHAAKLNKLLLEMQE